MWEVPAHINNPKIQKDPKDSRSAKIAKDKQKYTPISSSAKLLSAKLPHAASVIFSSGALQEKERRVNILYWIDGQDYLSMHIHLKKQRTECNHHCTYTFSLLVCLLVSFCLFPSLQSANCVA